MAEILILYDDILPRINGKIVRINSDLIADIHVKYENYCYTVDDQHIYEKIDDVRYIDSNSNDTLPYIPFYQNNLTIKVMYVLHLLNYKNFILCNMKYMNPTPFYENKVPSDSVSAITMLDLYMTKQFYDIVKFTLYDDDLCLPQCITRYNTNVDQTLYDYLFNDLENVSVIKKYCKILQSPVRTVEYMLSNEYKKMYRESVDKKFMEKYFILNAALKIPINKNDFNTILTMYDHNFNIYSNMLSLHNFDSTYIFLHFLKFENEKEIFDLPIDFKTEIYKKLNPDLYDLNDRELLTHFNKQGLVEERNIYENLIRFDWKIYVEMNNLQFSDKYSAEYHYLTFGKKNKLLSSIMLPRHFSYDLYIKENPTYVHMKKSDVLKQYLLSSENNAILPSHFNTKHYEHANPDLKFKNSDEATNHFMNYGIYENRDINSPQIKYGKIILLLCHIGDINVFMKMEHYILNAIEASTSNIVFKIVLNVVNTLPDKDKEYINRKYADHEIRYNDNFGFDIGSFFLYLKKCRNENITYDYIIKIHTKTSDIERDNLIKPLLGSVNRIKLIIDMLSNEKIGLIGSKKCMYYNYDKLAAQNQNWLVYLLQKYNINISYNRMVQFIGGTVFFVKFSIIQDLFSSHDFDEIISELNNIDTFDWNWYICANKNILPDLTSLKCKSDALKHYKANGKKYNLSGNLFHALKYNTKSLKLRDAMIEHAYERLFSYAVEDKSYVQLFLPYESYVDKLLIQPVPIIFPQFHVIPENNKFWSDGFTEWTMLNKVTHNYLGNKLLTPHKDLGQYDILDEKYLDKTSSLMKDHLIKTVIYYHYWFKGHKVMWKPIEKIRDEGKPNVNFVLAWANETWSSRWDGQENQILLKQDYGIVDDWLEHIEYLLTFFKADNYVVIDNKPLFYIYRPLDIPYKIFDKIMETFSRKCVEHAFDGIMIIIFYNNTNNLSLYTKYKNNQYVDGIMDFNPNYTNTTSFTKYQEVDTNCSIFGNEEYNEEIYLAYNIDIMNAVNGGTLKNGLEHYNRIGELEKQSRTYKSSIGNIVSCYNYIENEPRKHDLQLYSTFMGWDNTPRRDITKIGMKPTIFLGPSPQAFEQHIKSMVIKIIKNPNVGINWLILNAWNEWNEQTMLEPNSSDGYKYLKAVKKVFEEYY